MKKYSDMYITDIETTALYIKGVVAFMEADYEKLLSLDLESIYEYKEKFPK